MKNTNFKILISIVVFLVLVAIQVSPEDEHAKPQIQDSQSTDATLQTAVQTDSDFLIKQKVEWLEYRLNIETKFLEKRFEDFFKSATYFVSFLTIFVALLTIYNLYRGWQQHKDYLAERSFYEQRALSFEERQRFSLEYAMETSRNVSTREDQFSRQQIQLGENVLGRSSEILSQQIQNIEKLGAVIDLVRKTFDLQLKREEAQSELLKQLKETNEVVDQFKNDFRKKYADAEALILNFKDIKAMQWPSLPDEAQNIAQRARSKFEDVSSFVFQEEEKNNPYGLARVLQLIGTSAYCSNDIAFAFDRLKEAYRIYQSNPRRPEDVLTLAYNMHFLGIAEKNWRLENSASGSNIEQAHRYLSEAFELVKEERRQFLIPVTLAEVLCYMHGKQEEAGELINTTLNRITELRKSETLDANQRSLLIRLYLLKGNLSIRAKRNQEACSFYKEAYNEDPKSSYSYLSFAHALSPEETDKAKEHWEKGLMLLEESGFINKREITTKVMALVWAIISSNKCNKESKENYLKEFESIGKNIRSIAHRLPLFFSPLSKDLLEFADLKADLFNYLAQSKTHQQ